MINKAKRPIRLFLGMMGAILAFSLVLFACSEPEERLDSTDVINVETTNDSVFTVVEVLPQFPGGMDSLVAFLSSNINYPAKAKTEGIEGKVFVNFIIDKTGSVNKVKVLKGIGYGCDEEATRVVSSLPDWIPGMQRGKEVNVSFNLPINFNLGTSSSSDSVLTVVEMMPKFPGGTNALIQYISANIKYPEQAKKDSIQGKVYVSFVVEKNGEIGDVKVLRGIGSGCDEESVRVISTMPAWTPGRDENGEAVRVAYNIPIKFALN